MAKQIEPGLYKAEWTDEEREELYSLSDTEIEEAKLMSCVETAELVGEDIDAERNESDEDSE